MTGQPHNFGECKECGCLTTRLMEATNLVTGAKDWRVCCLLSPGHHWRSATDADHVKDQLARSMG